MNGSKDQMFGTPRTVTEKFRFDAEVAAIFEDMISRSVPGYRQILQMLPSLIHCCTPAQGRYYDLGCSLGAGMLAMAEALRGGKATIIGIDNSAAMIEQASQAIARCADTYECDLSMQCADILDYPIESADMVLMNFTLQFIELEKRDYLIQKIYDASEPGGILIVSEKVCFADPETNRTLIDIHHQYKADQGYSQLEISQKRDALEDVLIPETIDVHINRMRDAGYRIVTPWLQNLQFVSLLAIK